MKFYRNNEIGIVIGVDEAGVHEFREIELAADQILPADITDQDIEDVVKKTRSTPPVPAPKVQVKKRGRQSSITDEVAETIRGQYQNGIKVPTISQRTGVSVSKIYSIVAGVKKGRRDDSLASRVEANHEKQSRARDDDKERVRTFRCEDEVDCGQTFKKNTSEHIASCPQCGMTAKEV